jgi:DNA-directed RNA polymerase subunit E'/Rpb7
MNLDTGESKNINRRICLDPKFLDNQYIIHLTKKLEISTKDECSLEHGYILKVNSIVKILNDCVSPGTSDIVFSVVFNANVLKPKIGSQFIGRVCMIFPPGLLVSVQERLKVLIPVSNLNGYDFVESSGCFKKNSEEIREGDILKIEITGSDYRSEKKDFSCFGKYIKQ